MALSLAPPGRAADDAHKILAAKNHQETEKQLNDLGADGWRLATVLKAEDKPGTYLYYLVRAKP